jgi:hypothetical protein
VCVRSILVYIYSTIQHSTHVSTGLRTVDFNLQSAIVITIVIVAAALILLPCLHHPTHSHVLY